VRSTNCIYSGTKRADIESLGRDMEANGGTRATIARRLCTIAGFYRYVVEEDLLEHSPAAHVRRPRLDYESHVVGWTATRTARGEGRSRRIRRWPQVKCGVRCREYRRIPIPFGY
jgi:hypothetical protein